MSDGPTETWPDYLRRMTSRPGWSVARLARESKIHRGTIFNWIAGKSGATTANVRAIGEALGDLRGATRAATAREQDGGAERPVAVVDRESTAAAEIAEIMTYDIPDHAKLTLIEAVMRRQRPEQSAS